MISLGLDGAAFSSRMPADKLTKQEIEFFSDIAQGSNSTILDFIFVRNKIVSSLSHKHTHTHTHARTHTNAYTCTPIDTDLIFHISV